MSNESAMKTIDGDNVSLKSVHIEGEVNGLLLNVTTQQHYVNKTRRNLEVVYTFPLPAHAVILGVELQIADKTLKGVVMEKSKAEENYEEAIREGDLPVMVERSGPGLYTANLGNLKRGQEVAIKVQWAQLLTVRDRAVRIAVPTVIGKRYGDAHAQGGLAAHQTDDASPLVEYPLSFVLAINGELAQGKVSCATHAAQVSTAESDIDTSKIVTLNSGACMDRDVVITLSDLKKLEFYTSERNPDGSVTALASFYPALPRRPSPIALKILVDCSGSMEGISIGQAKEAVHQVLQRLDEGDFVSYSRFGTHVVHNFGEPHAYDLEAIEDAEARAASGSQKMQRFKRLILEENGEPEPMLPVTDKKLANIGRLIKGTKASMGGTEMRSALLSTINQVVLGNQMSFGEFVPCILLITDGDIWDHAGVVGAARSSGLRIFTIGVGSAPAESLLRELTEITGGVCEFVTPGESMAPVALRMVESMRSAQPAKLTVNWPEESTLKSALQSTVFSNETIHAFASVPHELSKMPVLIIDTPNGVVNTESYSLPIATPSESDAKVTEFGPLARIAAHGRLVSEQTTTPLQTAMDYKLVSAATNLFLVHTRVNEDKTTGLPTIEQIKQMTAAGQFGLGVANHEIYACAPSRQISHSMVLCAAPTSYNVSERRPLDQPIVWRTVKPSIFDRHEVMTEEGIDKLDIPAFLRKQADDYFSPETSPALLIETFNRLALRHTQAEEALDQLVASLRGEVAQRLIEQLDQYSDDHHLNVTVLLVWISEEKALRRCQLTRHALRLISQIRQRSGLIDLCDRFAFLDQTVGSITPEGWGVEPLVTNR